MRLRLLWELPAVLSAAAQLSFEAYSKRLREGRNPFSPTFAQPLRTLPRVAVEGRTLSQEPFLRPTRDADCHAPEVLALAAQLGAGDRGDRQYAEAIFDYVSNRFDTCFDMSTRRGVVGTMERGFGTCVEKLNLFVALARAGGIPARYGTLGAGDAGLVSMMLDDVGRFGIWFPKKLRDDPGDPRAKRIASFALRLLARFRRVFGSRRRGPRDQDEVPWEHYVAELLIEGRWIPADPTYSDGDCAALHIPPQGIGHEPFLMMRVMGMRINGRMESVPSTSWSRYLGGIALYCLGRGYFDQLNNFMTRQQSGPGPSVPNGGRKATVLDHPDLDRGIATGGGRPH